MFLAFVLWFFVHSDVFKPKLSYDIYEKNLSPGPMIGNRAFIFCFTNMSKENLNNVNVFIYFDGEINNASNFVFEGIDYPVLRRVDYKQGIIELTYPNIPKNSTYKITFLMNEYYIGQPKVIINDRAGHKAKKINMHQLSDAEITNYGIIYLLFVVIIILLLPLILMKGYDFARKNKKREHFLDE